MMLANRDTVRRSLPRSARGGGEGVHWQIESRAAGGQYTRDTAGTPRGRESLEGEGGG